MSSCKISVLDQMLGQMGMGDGRLRFVQIGTNERGRVRTELNAMLEHLTTLKEVH